MVLALETLEGPLRKRIDRNLEKEGWEPLCFTAMLRDPCYPYPFPSTLSDR